MAGHTQPTQLKQASSSFGLGVLLCLLATAAWGSLFPVMTAALRMLDPFTFTTLRFAIAGSLLAALLLLREGRSAFSLKGQRVGLVWFLGTLGFAGFGLLVFIGQHLAGVQGTLIASVMMATQPMLSLLANWAIHRVRPSPWSCCFLLLSFCGVLLVVASGHMGSASWSFEHAGAVLVVACGALCWVLYTTGGTLFPSWSPYRYTTLTALLGWVSIALINLLLLALHRIDMPSALQLTRVAPWLLYTAIVPGFFGVLCWNVGVSIITPVNGVLFMDIIPMTAFTISALQGVIPTEAQVCGVLFTMCAIVLNNFYLRRTARAVGRG